jgi:UDP-N-acetylglucosamine--N-acetylmuramyl-(pentapeptide) pyrophosphoryl-undecaprenol N-acetylglucosamine transferase
MTGAIVLAAGGTGGHLFPAQALARELGRRGHGIAVFTDRRGAAYADSFEAAEVVSITSATPSGRGPIGKLAAVVMIGVGALQARRALRRVKARVVVGFGGYPSLPTLLAAPGMKARIVLHEQNAFLGRVNRLMVAKAQALALSFEKTAGFRAGPKLRVVTTGNPVRDQMRALARRGYQAPAATDAFRLLVFGGSQGARRFGEVVPAAVRQLSDELRGRLQVVQQCRAEDGDEIAAAYHELGIEADVRSFFDELPRLLGQAHLVVARAGAGTVSELAVAGRPALLTPYPFATDDHQTANAEVLAGAGGAVLLPEGKLTPEELAARIESLARRPDVLARMAERATDIGRPDAAERLADLVVALANSGASSRDAPAGRAAA